MDHMLTGTYTYDYDILTVHDFIRQYFKSRYKTLPELRHKVKNIEARLAGNGYLDYNTKVDLQEQLVEINHEINQIQDKREVKQYMQRAHPLLDAYQRLEKFKCNPITGEAQGDPTQLTLRKSLIKNYLEVAATIINHNITCQEKLVNRCLSCDQDLDILTPNAQGLLVCACGIFHPAISNNPVYVRNSTSSNMIGSDYQSEVNFTRAIDCYQGTQPLNKQPPNEVYDLLEKYLMTQFSYPHSAIIRSWPVDVNGEKIGTNRDHMYTALEATGNSKYYKDINLICYRMWGWTLDNIEHLRPTLIRDFRVSETIYNRIKIKYGRRSSINSQLRLYLHLRKLNHPCNYNRFKIPDTEEIINELMQIWDEICEELNWKQSSLDQHIYHSSDSSHCEYIKPPMMEKVQIENLQHAKTIWPSNQQLSPIKNDDT